MQPPPPPATPLPTPRLHEFIESHAAELIEQCRLRAKARGEWTTAESSSHGIGMFIPQLVESLRQNRRSGDPGVGNISATAVRHGSDLQREGFTVNQVVHGYGDLCQAITDLAVRSAAPISTEDFRSLNGCLDHAIAEAVTEFNRRDANSAAERNEAGERERLGSLAHELRNHLNTATLAFAALKTGAVGTTGATSAIIDRSLLGLGTLIERALAFVRLTSGVNPLKERLSVDRFIAEVEISAGLAANGRGALFSVSPVPPGLYVQADPHLLHSAISNLLDNAFKYTKPGTHVALRAQSWGDRVLIEVSDECGGLPKGTAELIFRPFEQASKDRSGLGLGLTIARRAVEALDGRLGVRDVPGHGCVFTVDLPRRAAPGFEAAP